jgi:vancomycin resistance protein VanJ
VSSPSNARDAARGRQDRDPRGGSGERAPGARIARAALWAVAALAILYPVALAVAWVLLWFVGERWWATGLALYVPMLSFGAPLPVLLALLLLTRRRGLLWTQGVAAVILVFGLMGFVLPRPRFGAPSTPVVRVLSFNVDSGRAGFDRIVAEIDRYSPDIAVLQEVAHTEALEPTLRERYATVIAQGQFVLATRYPVLSTKEPDKLSYSGKQRSPRFLQHVIDTPLGQIALYDVHPLSPREDLGAIRGKRGLRREILSGRLLHPPGAEIIQENSGLRALQAQTFAEQASRETLPTIIAGDTNLPSLSNIFEATLSRFQDGFREAGWGFGYTFPAKRPWMRIDRIMASASLRFIRFAVGNSGASDHRCVVADITSAPP